MTDHELLVKARELMAAEYERDGALPAIVASYHEGRLDGSAAIRAIIKALRTAQPPAVDGGRMINLPNLPKGRPFAHGELVYSQEQMFDYAYEAIAALRQQKDASHE